MLTEASPRSLRVNVAATRPDLCNNAARKRYCQTGSYFGVAPRKHANGRFLWPAVVVTKHGVMAANDDAIAGKGGVA